MSESTTFEGWAILELMGHRRLGGYVTDVEMFGGRFCRIDIPGHDAEDGNDAGEVAARLRCDGEKVVPWAATQFYGASSVYCLTPTTADVAIAISKKERHQPVQRWELPAPVAAGDPDGDDVDMADDDREPPF